MSPEVEVMLMKRPHFCSRISGAAARVTANVPLRWVSMTASHSSSLMLKIMRSRRMPALFTTTSTRPKASSALLMIACPPAIVATALADLVDDLVGRRLLAAGPRRGAAVVVDDHARAVLGHEQRDLPADTTAGPRDDD